MAPNETVLTVAQLNNYAKGVLESDVRLRSVKVRGELTGFKRHYSGHLYFSLKDESALIRCVMFKSSAASLRFEPEDGMLVVLSGSVSIFPRDGQYQLYCSTMRRDGEGELYLKFLELKQKLDAEGLFSRKRPIPFLPGCVGVVTSESGAALHDILTVIGRRFPKMNVLLAPAQVQGSSAPASIISAIRLLNDDGRPDVLIVGRGGGSYEDLSCFNDEGVARAIYESRIPVVSAVGHEVDFTIADFAADLRAPTPSAAAELSVPVYDELSAFCRDKRAALDRAASKAVSSARDRVMMLRSNAALAKPATLIAQRRERVERLLENASHAVNAAMAAGWARADTLNEKLEALSPYRVLGRGYAIVRTPSGAPVKNAASLLAGDGVEIAFADGSASAVIAEVKLDERDN